MGYRPLQIEHIADPRLRDIGHRTDMYLHDVYGMFQLPKPGVVERGGCNYSIALVLLCVIDGLSVNIYPTREKVKDDEQRFKKLIRDKLHWGSSKDGWLDKGQAASFLYLEFRNPLVHEIAIDKPSRARWAGEFGEPIIGKWGNEEVAEAGIDTVDSMETWNDAWPTVYLKKDNTKTTVKLSCATLYWSVKRMAENLFANNQTYAST